MFEFLYLTVSSNSLLITSMVLSQDLVQNGGVRGDTIFDTFQFHHSMQQLIYVHVTYAPWHSPRGSTWILSSFRCSQKPSPIYLNTWPHSAQVVLPPAKITIEWLRDMCLSLPSSDAWQSTEPKCAIYRKRMPVWITKFLFLEKCPMFWMFCSVDTCNGMSFWKFSIVNYCKKKKTREMESVEFYSEAHFIIYNLIWQNDDIGCRQKIVP